MSIRVILLVAGVFAVASRVAAAPPPDSPPPVFEISWFDESDLDEKGIVSGAGRVRIRSGDFELSIENGGVVLWVDPEKYREFRGGFGALGGGADEESEAAAGGDAGAKVEPAGEEGPLGVAGTLLGPTIRELYAEGDVRLVRDGSEVRAKRLFFNFVNNRAVVLDAEFLIHLNEFGSELPIPLRLRADALHQVAKNELAAHSARLTTCLFGEPHYELTVSRVHVRQGGDNAFVRTEEAVVRVGEVPVLWLPFAFGSAKGGLEPIRDVFLGNSSRYGALFGVEIGGGIRIGEGDDERTVGDWSVQTLYRSKRGPGVGADLEYELARYAGRLRAFYQRDRADSDHISGLPNPREDRGRVRWQHRHEIAEDFLGGRLDALAEASWLSDRGFLSEYYPGEAKAEKEQENFAFLDWTAGRQAASALGRIRGNEFQTQTEYVPRLDYDMVDVPLLADLLGIGELTLTGEAEVSRMRRTFDHRLPADGVSTSRAVGRAMLSMPMTIGILRITPEAGAGATRWSDHLSAERQDAFFAVRASTDFWRIFPEVRSDLFDLTGLRHVVSVTASYVDRFHVSRATEDLVVQDREDLLDEIRAIDLVVRNRLETKREGEVVEFLDLRLRGIFFPERMAARPAPFEFREEHALGMSAQLLPLEEKWRSFPRRGMGPVVANLRAQIRPDLALLFDAWYEFETGHMETWAAAVQYEAFPDVGIYLGHRTIRGDSAIVTASVDFEISARWNAQVFQQVDLKSDGSLVSGVSLRRRYHDFVIEFQFRRDEFERETSFSLGIEPAIVFDAKRRRDDLVEVDWTAPRWYR